MSTGHVADRAGRRVVLDRWLVASWVIALAIIIVDQVSKIWVDGAFGLSRASEYAPNAQIVPPTDVVGDLVRITKIYNNGGLFGLFSSSAMLFAAGTVVVIGIIAWYQLRHGSRIPFVLWAALTLLLAAAGGNLVDRLRQGYVIDFVDMGIGATRWYVFNIADASVSIAIVLLAVAAIFGQLPAEADEADATRQAADADAAVVAGSTVPGVEPAAGDRGDGDPDREAGTTPGESAHG